MTYDKLQDRLFGCNITRGNVPNTLVRTLVVGEAGLGTRVGEALKELLLKKDSRSQALPAAGGSIQNPRGSANRPSALPGATLQEATLQEADQYSPEQRGASSKRSAYHGAAGLSSNVDGASAEPLPLPYPVFVPCTLDAAAGYIPCIFMSTELAGSYFAFALHGPLDTHSLNPTVEAAMLFEPAAFHHCIAVANYAAVVGVGSLLRYTGAPPACLSGERVAFLGDSVVSGTHDDLVHMWAHGQRGVDGTPVDKLKEDYCAFDKTGHKWVSRVRRSRPTVFNASMCTAQVTRSCGWFSPSDCNATEEGNLANYYARQPIFKKENRLARVGQQKQSLAFQRHAMADAKARAQADKACRIGASVQFTFGFFKAPFRRGLKNYLKY
mmetsp:Transcript_48920/g.112179  ORF Transcript_48920/g.112179 Transcript_48920/m.112179 type:complete len:383 (-) Transcript_48920:136-1284(-)